MKLYYKGNSYKCQWKSEMKPNMWYNFEPVKLKMTLPEGEYNRMISDIKDSKTITISEYHTFTTEHFNFDILIQKGDKMKNGLEQGLYGVESQFERGTIASKFKDGTVSVIIQILAEDYNLKGKDEMRDTILNDLFKSEKQE